MIASVLAVFLLGLAAAPAGGPIVHEWGTFTSITTANGAAVAWDPLVEVSDLPRFVNRVRTKVSRPGTVRMETPVVYFYSDRPQRASVEVAFPKGMMTEWYPAASDSGLSRLAWRDFEVLPGISATLPVEGAPSHYYPARETDAALLRVGRQHERFLFYRGVGTFALPLSARLEGSRVHLRAARGAEVGTVVVFESRDGQVGYTWGELRGGEAVIDRPVLGGDGEGGLRVIGEQLEASGLYPREASAMLATWRDTWTEEGCRVFYVLPRAAVDEILPLTVQPEPSELVRVLVGRLEILTPERENGVHIRALAKGDPDRFAPVMRARREKRR
jgi:hypothetical protein